MKLGAYICTLNCIYAINLFMQKCDFATFRKKKNRTLIRARVLVEALVL